MKKIFGLIVTLMMISANCFAMTFSQPVKIGGIGFPTQSPYHYYLVDGATFNNGKSYTENPKFADKRTTYKEGTAVFGNGNDALYCQYSYSVPSANSDDWRHSFKFGGKNNYIISIESQYKKIYKIDSNEGLTIYSIVRISGSEQINIIGRQKDGKWVSYINTEILTNKFFGGKQAYKAAAGVHYETPEVQNDTIIIPYDFSSVSGRSITTKGEFRFKWDDKAQWFGIEQIIY